MMQPGERFNGYSHLAGLAAAGVGAAVLLAGTLAQGEESHRTSAR